MCGAGGWGRVWLSSGSGNTVSCPARHYPTQIHRQEQQKQGMKKPLFPPFSSFLLSSLSGGCVEAGCVCACVSFPLPGVCMCVCVCVCVCAAEVLQAGDSDTLADRQHRVGFISPVTAGISSEEAWLARPSTHTDARTHSETHPAPPPPAPPLCLTARC